MGGAKGIKGRKDENSGARIYGINCVCVEYRPRGCLRFCVVHRPRGYYVSPARPQPTGDVCPIQRSFGVLNFV